MRKRQFLQTSKFKKPCFISAVGVGLMLFGIFELFLLALYQHYTCESPLGCALRKSDFMRLNLQNILIFTAFGTIFTGILTELRGVFLLSKMARDMRIFYDKLNLYFAASLFFALTLKDIMASSDYFFMIKIGISHIERDNIGYTIYAIISFTTFTCIVYFLCKNSIYLSKVFYTALFKNRFIRWIFYIILTILVMFLSSYITFGSFSIIVFLPYLLSLLIVYYKISKTDEAKKITLNEKVNTASYYIAAAIAVFLIIIILAALSFEVVASILMFCFFIFIISMISIFPLLIILILQSYDLIKTVICVAVIETVVFWAFLFTPFYAALFIR